MRDKNLPPPKKSYYHNAEGKRQAVKQRYYDENE